MQYVTDLHLHSKYARAVSPQMDLQMMSRVAKQKGLDVLSAADFTHPVWFKEISEQLEEAEEGLYRLKGESTDVRFMLGTEMSSIYKQGDKLRRIHNLIFVPSLEVADKFNRAVIARGGNLNADGRPIVGMSSRDLLELLLGIDERAYLIPAHIWTPHFGIYGSASGFDSLEEAFGDLAPYVFGIETGLSSDPDMNWQAAELMHRAILSFSDAHSAPKMAREATVVELESLSFMSIRYSFERLAKPDLGDKNKIAYTLEFYPEEGKYHFSGHRDHKIVFGPEEIRERGNVCPVCGRRLTEGVLYRVQQLSDEKLYDRVEEKVIDGVKWYTDSKGIQPPYIKLVQLQQIVAESLGSSVASKKTQALFTQLCSELTSELHVLMNAPIADIERVGGGRVAQAITKVREGNIAIEPGYDGLYGKVSIWHDGEEKANDIPQLSLDI
jgi:uncharacterized protein (TIGR00375 family)